MGRAPCCEKSSGLKKGPWTPEEDQKLIDYIQKHGYGNWRTLPKNAGLQRCGKSCRLRWTNYLRPDIKRGRFSFEEEETIIQLHSILGNKWSSIASRLPGRTDNEIKNYWNTHIRKRLLRMGIDPVTHSPRLDLSSILSQINIQRLLGMQPMVNPELLKLASSLLFSSQQCEDLNLCAPNSQHNQIQTNQIPFQDSVQQVQALNTPCFSLPLTQSQLAEPNENLYPSNFTHLRNNGTTLTEDTNIPHLSSYNYYGSSDHNQTLMDPPTFYSNNNSNQNISFASVLSTPSSSPTTLYSNSTTYINGSSSTEDERESYGMLKFEIPDILGVDEFM